jgi:hypothetical protein
MKRKMFQGIALASLVTVMSSPLYAQTATTANNQQPPEPVGNEAGYGVGAALASIFYIPAKVTYAGLGLLTGGLGFVLTGGRADVANNIIYPAVRGDYVVTPNNLKGTEPIYFVGAAPEPQPETIASGTTPARR